ncbi:MAG: glycoside hydrolase family 19 protein [Smithella sp.]
MNQGQLQKIFTQTPASIIARFVEPLNTVMEHYEINTVLRQAAFIAQIGHESGGLRYKEEIASGEAYDTGKKASALGNTPEADGDGQKFKGRGLIQITGKTNYLAFAKAFSFTLDEAIAYLKTDLGAAMSAGWFWKKHGLNDLADQEKFETITRRINGGLNGYEERKILYARAKQELGKA